MNTRTLALGLTGFGAVALVGWLLVSSAKPPHAQSAAVAATPSTVGLGTSVQAPSHASPVPQQGSSAPQMAVASAPSSTPTPPSGTTATKRPQVKYAQKSKVKAKARKSNQRTNVRRD